MSAVHKERPFFEGKGPVTYDKFAGREDLLRQLASVTWDRNPGKRQDYIMVLEGRTSFGKSSIVNRYQEEARDPSHSSEVIVCKLELTSDTGSPEAAKENFYNYLFDETYKAFSEGLTAKTWRWTKQKVRWGGARGIRAVADFELFGYTFLRIPRFRRGTPKAYFKFLKRLNDRTGKNPKAFALIIDDVSINERGPQFCGELLMELNRYSEADKWPADFSNFLLVLLPLPGWDAADTGAGLTLNKIGAKRRIDHYEKLTALSLLDIRNFLRRRRQDTGWKYDERAVPALYYLSGGIPRLMSRLGYDACEGGERRQDYKLKAEDLIAALRSPAFDRHVEEVIENAFGFKPQNYLDTNSDIAVLPCFYKCQEVENLDWGKPVPAAVRGMSRDDWSRAVLSFTPGTDEYERAFDKFWKAFLEHGILVQDNGLYRFHAEAIRRYLRTMV